MLCTAAAAVVFEIEAVDHAVDKASSVGRSYCWENAPAISTVWPERLPNN